MSKQSTSGGIDSTLASGHARGQSENESGSAEPTVEVRSTPAPQNTVNTNFTGGVPSEQDPRSSAAPTNGTRSPPAVDSLPPSMSYQPSQPSQTPAQSPLHHQQVLSPHLSQHLPQEEPEQDDQMELEPPEEPQDHSQAQVSNQTLAQQQQQQLRQQQQQQQQQLQQQLQQQQHQQPQQQPLQPQQAQPIGQRQHHHRHSHHHRHLVPEPQMPQKPEPPVTKATLSELDVSKIIHNPKLRHDINYDPELHFRPNLDGEKGRRKQEKALQFWNTLRDELIQFVVNREAFLEAHSADSEWTLPALLNSVKDIIQTLVPARDRELLNEGLNVPLLMQQFNRGVVDLEKLASWLSSVLKLHCAPMRDDWVDEMYRELSRGNRENDMEELVRGLSSLLSVLEAMKLDVANHQIRCLRPLLIEDTVHFEQRFFCKKIQTRRMSISGAQRWYKNAKIDFARPSVRHRQAFGETAVFFTGLCQLLMPSVEASNVPNTFLFDEDRILKLRSDMVDAIHLEVCMKVYELAEVDEVVASATAAGAAISRARQHNMASLAVPSYLLSHAQQQTGAAAATSATSATSDSWAASTASNFDFNTPPMSTSPMSSRPSSLDFSVCGSATSSPRNSSTNLLGGAAPPPQAADFAAASLRSQELYGRLVALLQTAQPGVPSATRWEELWPKMAVEMYRTLSTAQREQHLPLEKLEKRLEAALRPCSALQQDVERTFRERLLSALARRVKDYKDMPSAGLFVVAAGGRIHPPPARTPDITTADVTAAAATAAAATVAALAAQNHRTVDDREDGGVEDMATRLAHLGILHWRVWGPLIYDPKLPTEDGEVAIPV